MNLLDVNILVYAHREDAPNHAAYLSWLKKELTSPRAFGFSEFVAAGFLRVVTHPEVFNSPSPLGKALAFLAQVRGRPNCVSVVPGHRHWEIFEQLCRKTDVKGNAITDAYFAALAIESGCIWVTTNRNFQRFSGLNWRHPLEKKPIF